MNLRLTSTGLLLAGLLLGSSVLLPSCSCKEGETQDGASCVANTNPASSDGGGGDTVTDPEATASYFIYGVANDQKFVKVYSMDKTTGALTAISSGETSTGNFPHDLAFSRDGKFAYVVNRTDATVSMYSVNQTTGVLSYLSTPTVAVGTSNPVEISVHPTLNFAYVVSRDTSKVVRLDLDTTTGILSNATEFNLPQVSSKSVITNSVAISPDGKFLYAGGVIDGPIGAIVMMSIDPSTGDLAVLSPSSIVPTYNGSTNAGEVRKLIIDSTGDNMYASDYTNGRIFMFAVNKTTGQLTVPGGTTSYATLGLAGDIGLTPDNNFAYALGYSGSALKIFSKATLMEPAETPSYSLTHTNSITIPKPGKFAFIQNNQGAAELAQFSINTTTGALTPLDPASLSAYKYRVLRTLRIGQ